MTQISQRDTDRLKEIKKTVADAKKYFEDNLNRYKEFMRFVFKSSLTPSDEATLRKLGKPSIEFNIVESYISRQRGEFAQTQPSILVRAADGVPPALLDNNFIETIKIIEGHLRALFCDSTTDKLEYDIYTDLLGGGFSCVKVFTEYVNELSFEQKIKVEKVFDVNLIGFDPLARLSHKGDGRYCYELYALPKETFEAEFGTEPTANMTFTRELGEFNWSYKNEDEKIVLVCDFYEKKKKREKIIKLANGHTVLKRDYERFLEQWHSGGQIEQPPMPLPNFERWTEVERIMRYRLCESQILEVIETPYRFLPLVFIDGNSMMLDEEGASYQMTRPMCYQAKGCQRLENFAIQSLANEIENTVQHKIMVAKESIPEDYQDAYQNVQIADTLVYNYFLDTNNPNVTLPAPQMVARTPMPPEIFNTIKLCSDMMQTIMGTYDNSGIQNPNQSGVAISRSSIQSNSAAVPYRVGFIKGLNRICEIVVDLIPKYYRTPRSLPVMLPSGKRAFEEVNKKGSVYLDYDPTNLMVIAEMGVNFAMQKELALTTITNLMQMSPLFAQFMNQYGLPMLLDNIDIRGVEELKVKAEEFQQQLMQQQQAGQQAQQATMQMEQQRAQMEMMQMQKQLQSPTAEQLGLMSLQQKSEMDKEKSAVDAGNLAIKEREAEIKFLDVMSKIKNADIEAEVGIAKAEAENLRSEVTMAVEVAKHAHDANMDVAKHQHEMEKANKPEVKVEES